MADYNVNMKQWNGTSFDNVLPLAYNAKQLGGQSLAEVKQWVQDNELLLYSGKYIGTGTYGKNNPMSVTLPFEPVLFFMPTTIQRLSNIIKCNYLTMNYQTILFSLGTENYDGQMKKSADGKTITWYSPRNDEYYQGNVNGAAYYYAAIGGYDMGGATDWTITSSGSWTVPKTGRYMLELYGGGGGTVRTSGAGYTAGSSCQHYDSVALNMGDIINVTVGAAGDSGSAGGSTIFGSYSVSGGGGATRSSAGTKSGNYGRDGEYKSSGIYGRTYNDGVLGTTYGVGAGRDSGSYLATAGAVYLKYLGA